MDVAGFSRGSIFEGEGGMTVHKRVRNAMRLMRDAGKAVVFETDSGLVVITAKTKDAERSKRKEQRFIEHYRIHDRRGGVIKSRREVDDPAEIKLTLQKHEFKMADPERVL